MSKQYRIDELVHHGIKGQKWGVRRFQNKDGSLTAKGKKRYNDDEYDEERERLEQETAARRGVKYVRKTKKEREAEDAENEREFNARLEKDTAAQKRTEDRMKEVDKKLQAKYDLSSMEDLDKYYKEYDEEWFKILDEERKKEGLSHADMSADELYHYGIKGQKWGVRRFQNKDGSLTPVGRQRYSYDDFKNAKANIDKANEVVKSGKIVSETVGKRAQDAFNKQYNKQIQKSISEMSDKELREVVNRLNMEEQYTRMMQSRAPKLGKNKVDEILDYAGAGLTVASSAIAILLAIKELKK